MWFLQFPGLFQMFEYFLWYLKHKTNVVHLQHNIIYLHNDHGSVGNQTAPVCMFQ